MASCGWNTAARKNEMLARVKLLPEAMAMLDAKITDHKISEDIDRLIWTEKGNE